MNNLVKITFLVLLVASCVPTKVANTAKHNEYMVFATEHYEKGMEHPKELQRKKIHPEI